MSSGIIQRDVIRALREEVATLKDRAEKAEAELALMNVCEACADCLEPVPPRCERHVNTEPGDDESGPSQTMMTMTSQSTAFCAASRSGQLEAAQAAGACALCVENELAP